MEKLKIEIEPTEWADLISKFRPDSKQVSIANFTDGTVNIDTDVNGNITKRKGGPNYNGTLLAAAAKDQYEAIFSDGVRHLLVVQSGEIKYSTGDTLFNTVVNGSGFSAGANFEFATTQDRVYGGNGVNPPQVYDKVTSYGGVAYSAPRVKNMGLQVPATAPTAAVGGAGNVPAGTYTYKVTFLYYDSEESNGSAASNSVSPGVSSQINLTSIPIGGYGVTARNIYRSSGADWLLVGTIANNTATIFTDNVAAGTFLIPDDNNAPPVFALIASWLGRLWVAKITGEPYTLQFSDTNMPDIFLSDDFVLCNEQDPIQGLVVYLDRLIVFNRKTMGQILGLTSDAFRYSDIQGSVGCVDNRSIQIRVVDGVPILVWLSDRGFYAYDGNSIDYISEPIEDLVNFNIQQAVQQKGSHIQTTQAQFLAGTASPSIDLVTTPDLITALNPKRTYDDQADWEGGLTKSNIATKDQQTMSIPQLFNPSEQQGNFNNCFYSGSFGGIVINGRSNWTEWDVNTNVQSGSTVRQYDEVAMKITNPYAPGTITNIGFHTRIRKQNAGDPNTANLQVRLYTNGGSVPGSLIASANYTVSTPSVSTFAQFNLIAFSAIISTGDYWVGVKLTNASSSYHLWGGNWNNSGSVTGNIAAPAKYQSSTGTTFSWETAVDGVGNTMQYWDFRVLFSQAAQAATGQWTSLVYDSKSIYIDGTMTLNQSISTQTDPGNGVVQTYVEGSNDQSVWSIAYTAAAELNGSANFVPPAQYRYWRIRSVLSIQDDRWWQFQPIIYNISLGFPTSATWISQGIDCTSDVTAYNAIDAVFAVNSGAVSIDVATSADNISYSSFGPLGSATVQRYIRIRIGLSVNATFTSAIFKFTTVGNLISSGIDTGTTPSGWDVFQATFAGNVTFQMRSASTLGGLSSATFFTVTNGDFPTNSITPLQFVQWKAIITASADSLPTVSDVTINWFIGNTNNIRVASIFVDGRYYVAAAELGETTNNLLIVYDLKKKWRIYKGLTVSTFSYFFNRPYLGISTEGQIRRFLEGKTDAGNAIEVDIRTKAIDFSTPYADVAEKLKILAEVILFVIGTGATYEVSYSLDEGETFTMLKTTTGALSYTTANTNRPIPIKFKPDYTAGIPNNGRTIMFRIYSNDTNDVEVQGLKAQAWVREGEPVITG